jgi:hypothetical protein
MRPSGPAGRVASSESPGLADAPAIRREAPAACAAPPTVREARAARTVPAVLDLSSPCVLAGSRATGLEDGRLPSPPANDSCRGPRTVPGAEDPPAVFGTSEERPRWTLVRRLCTLALVAVLLLTGFTLVSPAAAASAAPGASTLATVSVNGVAAREAPTFWTVAVDGVTNAANSEVASLLNATPIKSLRYGALWSDETNWSTGCFYQGDSQCTPAEALPVTFGTLCRWQHDLCVLGVPAEPNNPSVDTQLIHWYATQTSWTPTCWAVGNEPEDWSHFNIPWTQWSDRSSPPPPPAQFAHDSANITAAIRHIYPSACVVGLENNDQVRLAGPWTAAVVAADPNVSAVAIHSYPDNHCTGPLLAIGNLTSLARNYENAVAASDGKPVYLHEFDMGDTGCQYLGTEANAVFVSANAAQALELGIPEFGYFRFYCGTVNTCMVDSNGNRPTPIYTLYSELFTHMDIATIRNVTLGGAVDPETFAAEGSDNATDASLLLSNADPTAWENVSLDGFTPSNWTGEIYVQGLNSQVTSAPYVPGTTVEMPPESTVVVKAYAGPAVHHHPPPPWNVLGTLDVTNGSPANVTVGLRFHLQNGSAVRLDTVANATGNFSLTNLTFNGTFESVSLSPGNYSILNVSQTTDVPQELLLAVLAERDYGNSSHSGGGSGNGTNGTGTGNSTGPAPPPGNGTTPPPGGLTTPPPGPAETVLSPGRVPVVLSAQLEGTLVGMVVFACALSVSGSAVAAKKAARARRLARWKRSLVRQGRKRP